jgi:hypothetical protein
MAYDTLRGLQRKSRMGVCWGTIWTVGACLNHGAGVNLSKRRVSDEWCLRHSSFRGLRIGYWHT